MHLSTVHPVGRHQGLAALRKVVAELEVAAQLVAGEVAVLRLFLNLRVITVVAGLLTLLQLFGADMLVRAGGLDALAALGAQLHGLVSIRLVVGLDELLCLTKARVLLL